MPVFIFMNNRSVHALKISLFVMLILYTIIPSALSASEEKKVAILDFVNDGPYERLDYLKYLLPQVLISGLAGQDGIAVLKRHQLEALIGESELAQKGFLEEKPFTPEEADIVVEGSWAEQPKPGLAFEETPLLIKAIVREGLSKKILGRIEVTGKREEFARIQKELVAGVLFTISGGESSVKEGKKAISSWEAAEHIGRGLAILKSIDDWASPASEKNWNKAIESFKRAIYLDPESSSLPYEKIAFCYSKILFFADKESEAAAQALQESIKWHGYLIDKFWDDSIICPQAMQSLMKDYYSVGMGNRGCRLELSESGEKEFFRRLEQLMGPLIERHSPSVYIQRSLRIAADVTEHFLREYKYSIRLRRKLLNECLDFRCNWWSNSKTWEANVEFLLPLAIAGTIRKSGHVEEAIKELEAAAKRNQNSKYVCHIHSRIADLAFAPNLPERRTNNYELAKKHFALAISSAERANQEKGSLCFGLALQFVGEKIIDDPSCSDSLRQEAFELNVKRFCDKENEPLLCNLPSLYGFLRRHADLYSPANAMLAKLMEKKKPNYEAPLSDVLNQIIWRKPVWHWKRSLGWRDFASSAVFKEGDVIWIALTTNLPCISLWQFNLNTCTVNYYADYTHVSKNIKITSIAKADSKFFIGTTDGLLVLNEKKKWEMFTTKDGLPFLEVRSLAVDKDSCWIGCGSIRKGNIYKGALCRYVWDTKSWKTYSMKSVPTALASGGDELWIGMWGEPIKKPIYKMKKNPGNKQVYRMNKNTGELCLVVNQSYTCGTYGPWGYTQWRDIPVVFYDEKNSIWCATTQECLQIDKSTNKAIFKTDKYISDITKNKEGYWLASYSWNQRLNQVHKQGCITFLGHENTYSIVISDDRYSSRGCLDKLKTVYPHKQFIWVIDDDMRIYGLERSMLHMPDALLKQIASAYRMKNIDIRIAVELLEKLKKPLPKSVGLRLEIADCYYKLLKTAKLGKKHRRNAYELELSKKLEFYKAKCIKAFQEAYELDHGSEVVLEAIKSAERNEHIKILNKK